MTAKPSAKTAQAGLQSLDPKEYPCEYYKLSVVAKSTGFSPAHLRQCRLHKYRFGNTDFLKVSDVNRYLENPGSLE